MTEKQQRNFLTPAEVVARWDGAITTGTLANWRSKSTPAKPVGPAFQKFGTRVRYPLAAVEAYERANHVGAANDNNQASGEAAA
jgi:hypothetical protein